MSRPTIQPLGDSAFFVAAPAPATLACQSRVWKVAERARHWPHIVDVVPGMNNLTIVFDPLAADAPALARQLEQAWSETSKPAADTGRIVDVPVHYGGAHGPDLPEIARHAGMPTEDVAALHAAGRYTVYFLGFQPGFAYLGGLDPRLHTPRRATPRLQVAAGSVGIGGEQTGIYPAASPGGWQLLGRSDLVFFDPQRESPCLMQPGDQVRFTIASVTA
ncbi:5-oxoprolinase subunit PxpB [Robbsia sp. Bb-Pol-6]|uniref:5-oxoprolinase subunit PxpB n=1 Tax=Robbsia betulipollinis TaxID=2981849 RepID=A0ABT3ZNT4_9BURK|nr:5-oxoprolinase subunit PxpB [Robbsia betulipollinis]MCY0388209.1 5-oxoprolinase subunit PxpB [Robbsia betulipollinis]